MKKAHFIGMCQQLHKPSLHTSAHLHCPNRPHRLTAMHHSLIGKPELGSLAPGRKRRPFLQATQDPGGSFTPPLSMASIDLMNSKKNSILNRIRIADLAVHDQYKAEQLLDSQKLPDIIT